METKKNLMARQGRGIASYDDKDATRNLDAPRPPHVGKVKQGNLDDLTKPLEPPFLAAGRSNQLMSVTWRFSRHAPSAYESTNLTLFAPQQMAVAMIATYSDE